MNILAFLKKPIVWAIIAILALTILSPWVMSAGIFDSWNTTGETWSKRGWDFKCQIDRTTIIGSWVDGSLTEQFTITGEYKTDGGTLATFKSYRYALYIEGISEPIGRFPADGSWKDSGTSIIMDESWHSITAWTGIRKATTGTVRLTGVLEVKMGDYFQTFTYSDPNDLAWDGAYVKSGRGEIYLPANNLGPFEEGGKVSLYVRTGFTSGKGWYVKVYPPADRTDLSQTGISIKTLPDDTQTYVYWTVPTGAFKIGSTNQWRAELWNDYFDVGFEQIFTIDQIEKEPIIKSVSFVNTGDSFIYTVTCEKTYANLDEVVVYAWYGYGGTTMPPTSDTQSWVQYDQRYSITDNEASFTITGKNIIGDIIVKIFIYDVDGRASEPEYQSFHVDEVGGTDPLPSPLEQPFIWTTTAIVLIVLIALGIIAIMFFAPVSIEIKALLIMVLGIAGAYLIWLAGTLQLGV